MQTIKLLDSNKKRYHNVGNNPHSNSMAAYLLLKRQYQRQDPDCRIQTLPYKVWLRFRNRLLKQRKKQNKGILTCVYCAQPNLVANFNAKVHKHQKATLDHVMPISKGGKKFDPNNLVVCCSHCNERKADKILTVSILN